MLNCIDIKIEENTIVQRDCSIVCNATKGNFLGFPPVSNATALKDRHTKFSLYEKFGIKYYLIVDPEKKELEIYCLEQSKDIQKGHFNDKPFSLNLEKKCQIKILLENFWE